LTNKKLFLLLFWFFFSFRFLFSRQISFCHQVSSGTLFDLLALGNNFRFGSASAVATASDGYGFRSCHHDEAE